MITTVILKFMTAENSRQIKGRHRPNAITQRDAIFLFSKVKKTRQWKEIL